MKALQRLTSSGTVPHGVWKRMPVAGVSDVVVHDGRRPQFRYVVRDGDGQLRALTWRGLAGVEGETIREFRRLATSARTVIDVGANTGLFTLVALAANPALEVVAFEPVDRIRHVLVANLVLNEFESRVVVHPYALADRPGHVDFILPDVALPTSAHLASAAYRSQDGQRVAVPTARMDDVVTGPVDLVKIDVEGAEDTVLRGMSRILTEEKPTIVVECLPEGPFRAVEAILTRHGYRISHLRRRGPVQVDSIRPDESRRYRNFLCIGRREPSR